jgi:hypothetical protein
MVGGKLDWGYLGYGKLEGSTKGTMIYVPLVSIGRGEVVMYRARLGSKARAWARLEWAQASIIVSRALVAGSGSARARLGLRPGLERENEQINRDGEIVARNVLRGLSLR